MGNYMTLCMISILPAYNINPSLNTLTVGEGSLLWGGGSQ